MLNGQKLIGLVLILLLIAGISYFAVNKFTKEVKEATSSPSPSPSGLTFLFEQTSLPNQSSAPQGPDKPSPLPSARPLEKVKRLAAFPGILPEGVRQKKAVIIQTAKGQIVIRVFEDVPQAASNFLLLAGNGFYDSLKFHRVEPNFVIQGGDPNGDGTGGPGFTFADEPVTRDYVKGIVAMANAGPNTNGSQFFIMLADHPELPKKYTIFGAVISGMDVVEKITVGDVMQKVIVQNLP